MRKHALFLTFIASVFAMQQHERNDEDPAACVRLCMENPPTEAAQNSIANEYQKKCEEQCDTKTNTIGRMLNVGKRVGERVGTPMGKFGRKVGEKSWGTVRKVRGKVGEFSKKVGGKVKERVVDIVNNKLPDEDMLEKALEEGVEAGLQAIQNHGKKLMTAVTEEDNFQNRNRPYGMFLQNEHEGLTMVYQDFNARFGEELDFINLSKGKSMDEREVEYTGVAAVKLANKWRRPTGVSGTSTIEIVEGEKLITTLEVYIQNPFVGDYKCCVTEVGKANTQCKPDRKQKIKSKSKGFFILKEPLWRKFENKKVKFCRIVIFKDDNSKIPAAPNASDLVQKRSSSDDEEDETDETA